MSRTKRKISSQAQVREDKEDLIKMIEALKSVKESRDINLALEELTLSFYITGSIKRLFLIRSINDIIDFMENSIANKKKDVSLANADRSFHMGSVKKLSKNFSHMHLRVGKKKFIDKIKRNVDLNNVDNLYDIDYNEVPNLGKIKGAMWYFD